VGVIDGSAEREELVAWLCRAHNPFASLEPDAPGDDLVPWGAIVAEAAVIGVGETVRGVRSAGEVRRVAHRLLREAVDRFHVRVVVLEERSLDAPAALDRYVRGAPGEAATLLRQAWAPWRSMEMLTVVEWLRHRNAGRPDDMVRVGGAVSDDAGIAGHVLDWHRRTGHRVVYWGGAAHTAVLSTGDVTYPPRVPGGPGDGAVLRAELGDGYLSVACICDRAIAGDPLPSPPGHFAESVLADVNTPAWYLDLRRPPAGAPQRWAGGPSATRIIGPRYEPGEDARYCLSGGSFGQWFDAIIYVRDITPATPLS
jgi:erythromycin esterase